MVSVLNTRPQIFFKSIIIETIRFKTRPILAFWNHSFWSYFVIFGFSMALGHTGFKSNLKIVEQAEKAKVMNSEWLRSFAKTFPRQAGLELWRLFLEKINRGQTWNDLLKAASRSEIAHSWKLNIQAARSGGCWPVCPVKIAKCL